MTKWGFVFNKGIIKEMAFEPVHKELIIIANPYMALILSQVISKSFT